MEIPKRQWNVVAGLAVVVVLLYIVGAFTLILTGKLAATEMKDLVLPVVTAVLGYLAALIGRSSG